MLSNVIKATQYEVEPYVVQSIYASKLSNLISDLLAELGKTTRKYVISKDAYEAIEFGKWYEQILIQHLRKENILIEPQGTEQVSVINGIVKGKIDAIVNLDGKRVIVEVKTSKDLPREPKIEHLYQLCYYMAFHPCDYGILHYADSRRNIMEFKINKNSDIEKKVIEKVNKINELYNNKDISKKAEFNSIDFNN